MGYVKQNWQDEVLKDSGKPLYRMKKNGVVVEENIEFELQNEVEQAGTLRTAERMMHIEEGIATAGQEFEADPVNIKPNGTAAVGVLETVARADHVHPASPAMGFGLIPTGDKIIDWKQPGCYRVLEWESYPDAPQDVAFNHATILIIAAPGYSDTGVQVIYSFNFPGVTFTRVWSNLGQYVSNWVKQGGDNSGWIQATTLSPWLGDVFYRTLGPLVEVVMPGFGAPSGQDRWSRIANIPYKPTQNIYTAAILDGGTTTLPILLNTAGGLYTDVAYTSGIYNCNFTYIV